MSKIKLILLQNFTCYFYIYPYYILYYIIFIKHLVLPLLAM